MKRTRSFSASKISVLATAISAAVMAGYSFPTLAQDSQLEEIKITGSRIARRDLSAPSPIVTVGSETFENSATISAESVLNQLPQFTPSGTQFSNSIQSGATSSPGAATLNLRGLGSNRNLVLINGRRAQPANAALTIDINTIPAAAIQSVEVITGGASAVYGADAMAGVVNFVMKDHFEGMQLDFQTGQTAKGDGQESRLSALIGVNAANGKGNILMGIEWAKRDPVYQIDRDFYRNGWTDPNNAGSGFVQPASYSGGEAGIPGGANRPSQAAMNSLFPQAPAGTVGNTTQVFFNTDGTPFVVAQGYGYKGPLNCLSGCGNFTGVHKLANGNLDQFDTNGFVSTPLSRYSFFTKAKYEVSDQLTAFLQSNYSHVEVMQRGGLPPAVTVWQAPIPRDGRAVPAALNTLLDSRANPNGAWSLYQVLNWVGPVEPVNTNNVWQVMAGLEGNLKNKDWSWEAYISRGETEILAENFSLPSLERYQFLMGKPNYGKGGPYAFGAPNPGGYNVTCTTGLPQFAQFTPSADCMESIMDRMRNVTKLTQDIAEANLQGGLFNLPAGEVRFSAGADWRRNTFRYDPGNPQSHLLDNPVGIFASNGTLGGTSVRELYGELLIPVLKGLDYEVGYRYSDYNTAGGVDTYKSLFTWKALSNVTLRGGYQFATRAPNTAELFTGPTQTVVAFPNVDPCSAVTLSPWGNVPGNANRLKVQGLCRAIIGNNTSGFDTQTYGTVPGPNGFTRQVPPFFPLEIEIYKGNPNVGVEKGGTWTLGAVISEPFGLKNLNVTVDAYKIKVTDAISPISSSTVYANCFNADGVSNPTYDVTNSFCKMIARNASTGDRASVDAPYFNLGTINTQGLDLQVNWNKDVGPGRVNLNTSISYLDKFTYQTAAAAPVVDATGTLDQAGQFKYRAQTTLSYMWSNIDVGLTWHYLSSVDAAAKALNPATTILGESDYSLFSLKAGYNMGKISFRVGIDNLFDKQPLVVGANPGVDSNTDTTNAGYYDPLGRRYYVGVKMNF